MIYTQSFPTHFAPTANPDAIVFAPNVRITILTSRLLRLEFDPEGQYEDRPSQAFWRRRQSVPEFSAHESEGWLEIETTHLYLRYKISKMGFNPETLSIEMKHGGSRWHFGQQDPSNLLGTTRTLDNVDGLVLLEPGLISQSGWALHDDSRGLVFNSNGWMLPRQASTAYKDLYFFGYGRDYNACLRDFRRVAGSVPLLPRWALGNWWSRYWAYTADELLALMDEFKARQVPLSVCIVDMDWHITDTGNTASGWTGYTWNRELFPDPGAFVAALHTRGLKTALNLHPAEGIHPHEDTYPAMAERVGIDPRSGVPVPFDIADPDFTRAYFETLHHPLEAQGIDFWWLDWQQGSLSGLPGLDPLWWLNHLHFYDLNRNGDKRPFIFSRWGGLGNHRYPIGFSGDSHVTWESLAFQPYFTATAANVGYGWWSHDIGGHMSGVEDPELYTRWVQYGVFSPIFRLHSTNNPFNERRPWGYDLEIERLTRDAMQLRHALIPYLYSMSWRDHHHALPLVRPMYHEYPDRVEAYHCPDQYLFGSELVAAPYLAPKDDEIRLSRQLIWLPDGDWYDLFNGDRFPGGWHSHYGALEHIPVFAKAGAVLPLGPKTVWGGVGNPNQLDIHLFPGADNTFELYEDDGIDQSSLMPIHNYWSVDGWRIQVGPVRGATSHLPDKREIRLHLRGVDPNLPVEVSLNGEQTKSGMHYEAETASLRLSPPIMGPTDRLDVIISPAPEARNPDYRTGMLRRLVHAIRMESWAKLRLDTAIPAILEAPDALAEFELSLTRSQMRAILEIVCGAGLGHMPLRRRQGEEIILWNNHQNPNMRYKFVANALNGALSHRESALPGFALISQDKDILHFQTPERESLHIQQATDWLKILPNRMEIDGLPGKNAVVQFDVTGQGGFQAYFLLQDGRAIRRSGEHIQPTASMRAKSSDFLALVNGEASPYDLFAKGILQVEGDLDLMQAFYRGIEYLPQDRYEANDWRLEIDFLGIFRL